MLNFNKVWELYNQYYSPKKIYPDQSFPQKNAQIATSLIEIADQYDILLLDGFGVLNVGDSAVPHMPEELRQLEAMGKSLFILTNGSSYPSSIRANAYPKLGYDIPAEYIISSRDAVEAGVNDHPLTKAGGTWGVIVTDGAYIETIPANTIYLTDENIDKVDGFIFLGTAYWDEAWQAKLLSALQKWNRPLLIGNPDISAPFENGFSIEPGFYGIELMKVIDNLDVQFFGKPFANAYDASFQKIEAQLGNIDRSRILMVGDTLHTDILGGNANGIKTALKADWGFLRDRDPQPYIEESGIYPDFIITNKE